ncbi:MAG: family 43 glycosylhydrolase [Bacteroidia bacterium]
MGVRGRLGFSRLTNAWSNFIRQNGGEPFDGLWAPYIMKVGSEYRLYYSLSSPTPRLSVIGLATASDPSGPFREKGLVVTSLDNSTRQTNAIDPTVIVDKNGAHWMYYGSAWMVFTNWKLTLYGVSSKKNDTKSQSSPACLYKRQSERQC